MIAFVLGNGISRQGIDVQYLANIGRVYGCNALYKTFTPTALIATDTPISTDIQKSGYSQQNRFYTRRPINGSGAKPLLQQYFGFSSGPNAVAIAAEDGNEQIILLGFDMAPTANGRFNNVFAGQEHYKPVGAAPTYAGNWVRQLHRVMSDYHRHKFVRIIDENSGMVKELSTVANLTNQSRSDFVTWLNTSKGT